MEIETLQITDLKEWENNARIHTRRNLEALKNSLNAFGQTKPILVQKSSMRIIAGNGTYQAICALGWETIDCRVLDISDEQAEALAIADNRTGDLSQWDERSLTEALKKIDDSGNLDLVGYDNLELERMLSYQSGDLFEKLEENKAPKAKPTLDDFKKIEIIPEPKEDKEYEQKKENIANYDEQISFILNGFVFTLANSEEIQELKCLIEILKDATSTERKEVNKLVFNEIKNVLTEKFMR